MHFAAEYNPSADVIRVLVDKGADIEARDEYQYTPLHRAADSNPSADVIRALVDKGADIDARDYWQNTPLHHAAKCNGVSWLSKSKS